MYLLAPGRVARLLLPFLFVLSVAIAPSQHATAAYQARESIQINRSIAEMARAEREGDYNLVYDLMLPDARMLIPRAAFVNWWPTVAPAAPADVLRMGDLTFADITYDLTGTDYANVATVSYSYHDAQGNALDRTVRLAEVDGVWRWLPDITQADLPEILTFAGFSVDFTSAYTTPLYRDLDTFWAQIFSDWGQEYRSPKDMIGVRVAGTPSMCGTMNDLDKVFAHYCPPEETIYFNPEMRDLIIERIGAAAWEMVIAHEWAHHIQNISGIHVTKSPELFGGSYTIENELQADCVAGIFMQDSTARNVFEQSDRQVMEQMLELGKDAEGTTWDDPTAHGTADQRREALISGYDDGLRGCHLRQ